MKHLFPLPILIALFALLSGRIAFGHAGHDHAPGEDGAATTTGPITISAEAKTNLNLKFEEAEVRTLQKTVTVIGGIEPIPSKTAAVTSRISGRVTDIKASEGERVKKGQPMVEVESRQIGSPPPRVTYDAPIAGVITHRDVLLNDSVEPDKHLLEIVDLSEVYVEGRIFEGQVARIKTGQKVRVSVESYPGDIFTGTIDLISGVLDAETRTLKVWVRVPNPDNQLLPNMRATLNIVVEEAESVLAIPHSAILGDSGNLFAFVQNDAEGLVYERRAVVTGIKDDRFIEVTEGIFPGDKVVTLGNYQLQYVTVKKSPPKPAAGNGTENKGDQNAGASGLRDAALHGPLVYMGGTIIGLLVLNLIAIVMRKGPGKVPGPAREPTE